MIKISIDLGDDIEKTLKSLEDKQKKLDFIGSHVIKAGIIDDNRPATQQAQRKLDKVNQLTKRRVTLGDLITIHHNGTKHIPARPVISLAVQKYEPQIESQFGNLLKKVINLAPYTMENFIKDYVKFSLHVEAFVKVYWRKNHDLTPLARATKYQREHRKAYAHAPHGNHRPLVDLGHLSSAIQARIYDRKGLNKNY